MKKIFFLTAILFISIVSQAQDVTMTAYEQARYDLANETITKLIESMGIGDKLAFTLNYEMAISECDTPFEKTIINENIIFSACGIGNLFSTEANYLAQSYSTEKAYSGALLSSWIDIGTWYKEQRNNIESQKTENDDLRETTRYYQSLGTYNVVSKVSKQYKIWAQKGEFEKTVNYQQRLKANSSSVLDSLCFLYTNESWRSNRNLSITKKNYDADTEVLWFTMAVKNNERTLSSIDGSFPISVEEYKKLDLSESKLYRSWARDMIEVNGILFPSSINLCIHRKYYNLVFENGSHYRIQGNQLKGIPEDLKPFVCDYVFDYASYADNITLVGDIQAIAESSLDKYPEPIRKYLKKAIDFHQWNNEFDQITNEQVFFSPIQKDRVLKQFEDICLEKIYNKGLKPSIYCPWYQELFPYFAVKDALKSGSMDTILDTYTKLAIEGLTKYAPEIVDSKSISNAKTESRAALFIREKANWPVRYEAVLKEIISNSNYLSTEYANFNKLVNRKYKRHPKFQKIMDNEYYIFTYLTIWNREDVYDSRTLNYYLEKVVSNM